MSEENNPDRVTLEELAQSALNDFVENETYTRLDRVKGEVIDSYAPFEAAQKVVLEAEERYGLKPYEIMGLLVEQGGYKLTDLIDLTDYSFESFKTFDDLFRQIAESVVCLRMGELNPDLDEIWDAHERAAVNYYGSDENYRRAIYGKSLLLPNAERKVDER